jgi:hypothetical protein
LKTLFLINNKKALTEKGLKIENTRKFSTMGVLTAIDTPECKFYSLTFFPISVITIQIKKIKLI